MMTPEEHQEAALQAHHDSMKVLELKKQLTELTAKIEALEAEVSRQRLKKEKHLDEVYAMRTEQDRLLALIDEAECADACKSWSVFIVEENHCDCFKSKARAEEPTTND